MGIREQLACQTMKAIAEERGCSSNGPGSRDWITFSAQDFAERMNTLIADQADPDIEPVTPRSVGWLLNELGVDNRRASNRNRTRSRAITRRALNRLMETHRIETSDSPVETSSSTRTSETAVRMSDITPDGLRHRIEYLCEAHQVLLRARDAEDRNNVGGGQCEGMMRPIEDTVFRLLQSRSQEKLGRRLQRRLKKAREA